MKFYLTIENNNRLKRSFLNLKLFSIIDVFEILEKFGYDITTIDEYGAFIVTEHINYLINTYSKSKRIRGIIYSHPLLNEDVINELMETLSPICSISDIVLLDDYNIPKLKYLYHNFDEIIYFPSIKKIRLIECRPIEELSIK